MSYYRYGFNGKEKDVDGEWGEHTTNYDYGFRIYNPSIGKFLSVDPLSAAYSMLTPYQFASNRPIDGIDLDGKEWDYSVEMKNTGKTKVTISCLTKSIFKKQEKEKVGLQIRIILKKIFQELKLKKMIKLVLFLCFILLGCTNDYVSAERQSKKDIECVKYFETRVNNYVYQNIELKASPKDGIKTVLSTFLLEFHPSSVESYVGTFQFEFFIDSFGKLQKVFILNKAQNQLTESEKEALKIMRSIIEWNPAKCNKIAVNSRLIIPIKL